MRDALRTSAAMDRVWLACWGLASSVWCVTAARRLGATFDEPLYIAGGLDAWRTASHAGLMKVGTMPLAVDLCTLPLHLWERWHGIQFQPLSNLEGLLPWARAGTLVFWWLLLTYGWRAGRQLAGCWGGRLAVALLACEPALLAHASLATTDIAISACLLALVYHFRTARAAGWMHRIGIPSLWFAASVLSKASALVFAPLCLAAAELDRARQNGMGWTVALRLWCRDFAQVATCGLVLAFLYCGSDWRPEPSFVAWAHSLPDGVATRAITAVAEHLRIFPNAGEGLVRQIKHNVRGAGGHWAYLLGDVQRAFWYYFPVALSIKMSVPLLALPIVLTALDRRALANWANLAAIALLAASLAARVQIGVRLVLPIVVFAAVGLAASTIQTYRRCDSRWIRTALAAGAGAGVLWTGAAAAAVWPNALCYTNALWGGTERGYLLLSDSNYDWGQGLPELAAWQRQHGRAPMDVWYFGTDPAFERLPFRKLPLHAMPVATADDLIAQISGHYLAVGTTLLYGTVISDAHRVAATLLRSRAPMARTLTFFIYDLTPIAVRAANGEAKASE